MTDPIGTDETLAPQGKAPRTTLPRPGDRLDHYEVLRELGRGAMGIVVLARDLELDRDVALKLLLGPSSEDRERRLLREAQAMAQLSHPNVVRVHGVGRSDHGLYIAMEFVRGSTLLRWLKAAKRSTRQILESFIAAGEGLSAAHRVDVVHRDFKPENVLVAGDGRVLVGDFGLANAAEASLGSESLEDLQLGVSLTLDGQVLGTPRYMAPEVIDGRGASQLSDQFAFGVSLYEALCEAHPFDADTWVSLRVSMESDAPTTPDKRRMRPALWDVVERSLRRDPQARYSDLAAMLEQLTRLLEKKARRRGPALLIVAAGGIAAGLAVGLSRSPCEDIGQKMAEYWTAQRAQAVEASLLSSNDEPLAAETAPRVRAMLDDYANVWTVAATESCERANSATAPNASTIHAQQRCLDRARESMQALVSALSEKHESVAQAVQAASSLPSPGECSSIEGESQVQEEVDAEFEAKMVRADALRKLERIAEAQVVVEPLLELATTLRQIAQANVLASKLNSEAGEYSEAEARAKAGAQAAADAKDDELLAHASLNLAVVLASTMRNAQAEAQLEAAQGAMRRIGDPPLLRAVVLATLGNLRRNEGRLDDALELSRLGLAHAEATGMEAERLGFLTSLAYDLSLTGQLDASIEAFEEAEAGIIDYYGEFHPRHVFTLRVKGEILHNGHRDEEARATFEEALRLALASPSTNAELRGQLLYSLAGSELRLGNDGRALELGKRSLAAFEDAGQADNGTVALVHDFIAMSHIAGGDLDAAEASTNKGMALAREAAGADHPILARHVGRQAEVDFERGRISEAKRGFERALELAGPQDGQRAWYQEMLAKCDDAEPENETPD